jgi:hypothetical protein
MLAFIGRLLARILGTTGRTLWDGGPLSRMFAVGSIVAVLVVSTSVRVSAISALAALGIILGCFVVLYSLILSGR